MKRRLTILALAVLVAGCKRDGDADLREKLVGNWDWDAAVTGVTGRTTFRADGTYTEHYAGQTPGGSIRTGDNFGTFEVRGGTLIDTLTNHADPSGGFANTNAGIHSTQRLRIIRLDGEELVVKPEPRDVPEGHNPTPTNEVHLKRSAR